MKIRRRYLVISFCPELTNPQATSFPVAVVGVGEASKLVFLFCGVNLNPLQDVIERSKDQFSEQILMDLPQFLEKELSEGLKQEGPSNLGNWLHNRLRNSLQVSFVSRPSESEIEPTALLTWFQRAFRQRTTDASKRKSAAPPLPDIRFKPVWREAVASARETIA